MRINDKIYFSPSLLLEKLDLTNKTLVLTSFKERIESYYFKPIKTLNDNHDAFASGAILCLLIDAFARYSTTEDSVGVRIVNWCCKHLCIDEKTAKSFYSFFRCGLLHESHIKNYGQFTFDKEFTHSIIEYSGFIVVNPSILCSASLKYFDDFIAELNSNDDLYSIFIGRLKTDFADEINEAKT